MELSLHKIKSAKGAKKQRKRIGRGNASGSGTYSGKGQKGQRSRSGVSNLKRLGMKQVLLRTPKKRGFKSLKPKDQVVNLADINNAFNDKDLIDPKQLLKKQLVDNIKTDIKILGNGKLTIKELVFKNVKLSASAREQVEKQKGKIE